MDNKGQFDSSIPIFQQIVERMLNDIAAGTLAPGDKVPAVRQLAAEYKVNPNTMQKSLEKLGDMGFLYTERTSGRFVTKDAAKIETLRRDIPARITAAYVEEMAASGIVADEIPAYVEFFLKERKGNGKNTGN
ncbi:MAG: GntR family transcriptional regulator [Defluviitaleaceae bacterium]|nr:GntR family transcriptional regulator [Defluviitaleaceae bacterium]